MSLRGKRSSSPLAETEVDPHQPHEVDGVAGVEHGEAGPQADRLGVLLQQPMRDGVERAAPHAARRRRIGVTGRARDQLVRGASAEGEQQQARRVGALVDEVREAGREGGGLARAGAGDDEQRRPVVLDGGPLRIVQNEHAFGVYRVNEHVFVPPNV